MWGSSDERKRLRVVEIGAAKGRGVIADQDIRQGELIERAPVLVIPGGDRAVVDPSIIFTYIFMWERGMVEEDLYKHSGRAGMALGYVGLPNHSYAPKADYTHHIEDRMIDVVALRDIAAGEEITIDYKMTLWIDPT